jgi:hypothetical protein
MQQGYKRHVLKNLPKLTNLDGERSPAKRGRPESDRHCLQQHCSLDKTAQANFHVEAPLPWFTEAQLIVPNTPTLAAGLDEKLMERFETVRRQLEAVSKSCHEMRDALRQQHEQAVASH